MSADQTTMDMSMPFAMNRVVTGIIGVLGILALMSQITWKILLLVIPVSGACTLYQVRTSTSFDSQYSYQRK